MNRIRGTLVSLTGLHVFISLGSISYALSGNIETIYTDKIVQQNLLANPDSTVVLKLIKDLYSGKGADKDMCCSNIVFRDPVAICEGIEEVCEAFRALKVMSPTLIEDPKLMYINDSNNNQFIEVKTKYTIIKSFSVHSICVVETDKEGKVLSIEERWNSIPLLNFPPFTWAKRINGIVSYAITRLLIK